MRKGEQSKLWKRSELKEKLKEKDEGEAVNDLIKKRIALGGRLQRRVEEQVGKYGSGKEY